ncbi:MAG: hypothetical protein HKN01_06135 [Acidimicrobiia bacterium]|nr:hypothetical protein [Acidimicrobiia bacterium]NNF69331.1 hypothetical protein [Acidimicrobiia bacterium]
MDGLTFLGPFLTRAEFSRLTGIPGRQVALRPDLLRLRGPLGEAYFAFQLDGRSIHPALGSVVHSLKDDYDDLAIADWLVHPHERLGRITPLRALRSRWSAEDVLLAAKEAGPRTE